eukprot:ANDGO_03453.mRNA.1 hypothetical protein
MADTTVTPKGAGSAPATAAASASGVAEKDKDSKTLDWTVSDAVLPPSGTPILRDLIGLHVHVLRFFAKAQIGREVFENERAQLRDRRGSVGRYGLWHKSAMVLALIACIASIIVQIATVSDKSARISKAQDKQDERVKSYNVVIARWTDLRQSTIDSLDFTDPIKLDLQYRLIKVADQSISVLKSLKTEGQNLVKIVTTLFGLELFFLFVLIFATCAVGLALRNWRTTKVSCKWLSVAWLATFLVPYIVSFIPFRITLTETDVWTKASDTTQLTADFFTHLAGTITPAQLATLPEAAEVLVNASPIAIQELADQLQYVSKNILNPLDDAIRGSPFAVMMFVRTAPPSLSLLPSLLTAAILFKTVFPVSSALPAVLVFGVPVFSTPLTIALFAMLLQIMPSPLLIIAAVLLASSLLPLMYRPSQYTSAMTTVDFDSEIKRRMRVSLILKVLSAVLIFAWLIAVGVAGTNSSIDLDTLTIINALLGVLRGLVITEPFWCDCMILTVATIHRFSFLLRKENKETESIEENNAIATMFDMMPEQPQSKDRPLSSVELISHKHEDASAATESESQSQSESQQEPHASFSMIV